MDAWTSQPGYPLESPSLRPLSSDPQMRLRHRTDAAPDVSGQVVWLADGGAGKGEEAELCLVPDLGTLDWWGWETPSET